MEKNSGVELVENVKYHGRIKVTSLVVLPVAESDDSDLVTGILERLVKLPGLSLVHQCKLGGVITSHAGPGALGITFRKGVRGSESTAMRNGESAS
jgi:fatty acid-binding protein DegV